MNVALAGLIVLLIIIAVIGGLVMANRDKGSTASQVSEQPANRVPQPQPEQTSQPQPLGTIFSYTLPADLFTNAVATSITTSTISTTTTLPDREARFWQTAFVLGKVEASAQNGRWLGGRVVRYGTESIMTWDAEEKSYYVDEIGRQDSWYETDIAYMRLYGTYSDYLAKVARGTADVHLCYGHDCFYEGKCILYECGVIGSTNSLLSDCKMYLWEGGTGLFFLMKIDETDDVCVEAYRRVAEGEMNEASAAFSCLEHVFQDVPYHIDGKLYELSFCRHAAASEITLAKRGRDTGTWVAAFDNRSRAEN